jgi:hypothetical protein
VLAERAHGLILPRPIFRTALVLLAAWACLAASVPRALADEPDDEVADLSALSFPSPVGPMRYVPGRGLHIGDTGLTIGGFSTLSFTHDEGGPTRLALDDLSFLIAWNLLPRVRFFSELEVDNLVEVQSSGRSGADARFDAERVYVDLALSDQINLRVGKFLTPVGRWNTIHAEPLVWTTSRPLTTEMGFDQHTTGAMLFGSWFPGSGVVNYSIYGQFVNQLKRKTSDLDPADRSAGARLEYSTTSRELSLGLSYYASTQNDEWQNLFGADGLWRHGPLELWGELIATGSRGPDEPEWGFFLQSALQVVGPLFLVTRYEHFDQRQPEPQVNLIDLGVAYKPLPFIVLKAEYLIADHRAEAEPPGFKSSLAVLF